MDHLNAQGYSADRLHGDMSQMMRDRVMQKFRKSGLEFLVATDVAARGIDVDDVEVVFNYDLPYDGEDYVHRIGRTGRKGREGRAISFASGREVFQIRNIERFTNMRIHRGKPPTAGEVEEARGNAFLDKLRTTLKAGDYKKQDHLIERLLEEGFGSTDIMSALMHHMQGGEVSAAKSAAAPREEAPREQYRDRPGYDRPDRASRREDRAPRDFAPRRDERFEDRRSDRRPDFSQDQRPARPADRRDAPRPAARTDARPMERRDERPAPRAAAASPAPAAPPAKPVPAARAEAEVAKEAPLVRPETVKDVMVKHKRRTASTEQIRLWMNIGELDGVSSNDVVSTIAGATGLPAKVVGTIDIRDRHLFMDVATEYANGIIAKLNRSDLKGKRLKVKVA